jgi:hypothetical protein
LESGLIPQLMDPSYSADDLVDCRYPEILDVWISRVGKNTFRIWGRFSFQPVSTLFVSLFVYHKLGCRPILIPLFRTGISFFGSVTPRDLNSPVVQDPSETIPRCTEGTANVVVSCSNLTGIGDHSPFHYFSLMIVCVLQRGE